MLSRVMDIVLMNGIFLPSSIRSWVIVYRPQHQCLFWCFLVALLPNSENINPFMFIGMFPFILSMLN